MKHAVVTWIAALLIASALTANAEDEFDIKVYTAAEVETPITLDGKLSEQAWEASPVVGGFTFYGKAETADPQTFFRIVYTDRYLYVGVVCDEPDMEKFAPVAQARDSMGVFHGETIEFFIDPTHSHSDYRQIAVNAAASIYDSRGQDPVWNADVKAATAAGETSWSMEIVIPWKDLNVSPEPGMLMGFNVCRDRYIGNKQWTNWARVKTGFHDPVRFAHLVLSPSPQQVGAMGAELRKGNRNGPIMIYGDEGVSATSYRSLAQNAVQKLEEALEQLRATAAEEDGEATRRELLALLKTYRDAVDPIRNQLAGETPIDAQQWARMDLGINKLLAKLQNAIWEARLKALLSDI